MRTIVHLSDLHFGRTDPSLLDPLVDCVKALAPDVVVISGDLTQRARKEQFIEAKAYLDRLPQPQVVVPGNHDVPLYNVFDRFFRPLTKYRRYVEPNLSPSYVDEEIAVLGVNTSRSLVVKDGRINKEQLETVRHVFSGLSDDVIRMVVTHHPFDVPEDVDEDERVGRAEKAMAVFAQCRVDVLMAGHLHVSHTADTGERYAMAGYEALVVSAGTATSTRGRGEANSFNVLRVRRPQVDVDRYEFSANDRRFTRVSHEVFERTSQGWSEST